MRELLRLASENFTGDQDGLHVLLPVPNLIRKQKIHENRPATFAVEAAGKAAIIFAVPRRLEITKLAKLALAVNS